MIRNELQYRVTKSQVERFERALRDLRERPPARLAKNEGLREIYEAGIRSQLEELQGELEQYEALSRGDRVLRWSSFEELPNLLVQARIAAGLTQRELADRLSMKEQQVQRYESTEYASASFSRMKEVALALGIRLKKPAILQSEVGRQKKQATKGARRRAAKARTATAKKVTSRRGSARTKVATAAAAKKSTRRSGAKARKT